MEPVNVQSSNNSSFGFPVQYNTLISNHNNSPTWLKVILEVFPPNTGWGGVLKLQKDVWMWMYIHIIIYNILLHMGLPIHCKLCITIHSLIPVWGNQQPTACCCRPYHRLLHLLEVEQPIWNRFASIVGCRITTFPGISHETWWILDCARVLGNILEASNPANKSRKR